MPQPLWNKESLENLSRIVPKGHRISESYATEKTSPDKDRASASKGVGCDTASPAEIRPSLQLVTGPVYFNSKEPRKS
jgi:hypothetical protein